MNRTEATEIIRQNRVDGVAYDADSVTLEGSYSDEFSLHRAKKVWKQIFEGSFLLDYRTDFELRSQKNLESGEFVLICSFGSACGRYAFWRLINHQSPEAQYLIETAHIPTGESRHEDFLRAPDLRPMSQVEQSVNNNQTSASLVQWLVNVLAKKDK